MTFNVPSFFAGVATVLLTLTVGFGGGVLMTGAFTDRTREPNKLERRAAEDARPAPAVVASPVPAAPAQAQASSTAPAPVQVPPAPAQASAPDPQPAAKTAAPQTEPPRPEPPAAPIQTADTLGPQRAVSLVQPGAEERPRDAHEASTKARDAKARAEKRKAERRRQIAERRLQQQMREEQQRAVSERLRREAPDEDEERPLFMRRDRFFEPPAFRFFSAGD